mgnify:CR=1 FL=1
MNARREMEERSSRERGWRRWGAAAALGPLALSLVFASPADALASSRYPCDPQGAGFSESARQTLAQQCIDDRHGTIALIANPDEIDSFRLEDIASRTEKLLRRATGNLIAPDLVPLAASPEAIARFRQMNPFCVDTSRVQTGGTEMTDQLMGLEYRDDIDHVYVLTNLPACNDTPGRRIDGLIWGDKAIRYGEVLSASVSSNTKDPDGVPKTLAHEIGHMQGYGHAGALTGQDKLVTLNHFKTYPNLSNDTEIDLDQVIAEYPADQYGSQSNIMGATFFDNNGAGYSLNGLQRKRLRWAETVLNPKSAASVKGDFLNQINGYSYVSIPKPTSVDYGFAVMNLDETVVLHDSDGELLTDPQFQFKRLVIDPVYDKRGYQTHFIEVYLATDDPYESLSTMSLGFLDLSKPENSNRTLELNGQKIRIRAMAGGGFVANDEAVNVRTDTIAVLQQQPR